MNNRFIYNNIATILYSLLIILCFSTCNQSNPTMNNVISINEPQNEKDLTDEELDAAGVDYCKEAPVGKITLDMTNADGLRTVEYKPEGVCSKLIHIEVDKDGIIQKVVYTKGCSGNTQGVGALIKGMTIDEAICRLQGIKCGDKNTSCPDQLANALKKI